MCIGMDREECSCMDGKFEKVEGGLSRNAVMLILEGDKSSFIL